MSPTNVNRCPLALWGIIKLATEQQNRNGLDRVCHSPMNVKGNPRWTTEAGQLSSENEWRVLVRGLVNSVPLGSPLRLMRDAKKYQRKFVRGTMEERAWTALALVSPHHPFPLHLLPSLRSALIPKPLWLVLKDLFVTICFLRLRISNHTYDILSSSLSVYECWDYSDSRLSNPVDQKTASPTRPLSAPGSLNPLRHNVDLFTEGSAIERPARRRACSSDGTASPHPPNLRGDAYPSSTPRTKRIIFRDSRSTMIRSIHANGTRQTEIPKDTSGIRILSFDGGGPGCFSQLIILDEIMSRVAHDRSIDKKQMYPADHFDLMGGVGFGAIKDAMKELHALGKKLETESAGRKEPLIVQHRAYWNVLILQHLLDPYLQNFDPSLWV
ncbi:4493_t:CDS:2, partial [Acaulospora colombiana]